jgi:toxin FitB
LYLLDTNIVSADAPAKRKVGVEVFAAWVREHSEELYISTVTIAEIDEDRADFWKYQERNLP